MFVQLRADVFEKLSLCLHLFLAFVKAIIERFSFRSLSSLCAVISATSCWTVLAHPGEITRVF